MGEGPLGFQARPLPWTERGDPPRMGEEEDALARSIATRKNRACGPAFHVWVATGKKGGQMGRWRGGTGKTPRLEKGNPKKFSMGPLEVGRG